MPDPQGRLIYAGYDADGPCQFTLSASAAPSIATASFTLSIGGQLPPYGDLVLIYGGWQRRIPNCRIKRVDITGGESGRWRQVIIEDRRWAWRLPVVYGFYNHYERGLKVDLNYGVPANVKSARELAALCLDNLGERNYDVSALPTDFYPPTEWDGTNAAEALEELVDTLGCQVVLTWDNTVKIVRRGIGVHYPQDARVSDITESYEPKVLPSMLAIESGEMLHQRDLPLEPVGYEIDSTDERPIDDLSYKPAGGWGSEYPGDFGSIANKAYRELAQSCIWKVYRVRPPFTIKSTDFGLQYARPGSAGNDESVFITGRLSANARAVPIQDELWRILPLEQHQLKRYLGPDAHTLKRAQIIGYFADKRTGHKNNETVPTGATLDTLMDTFGDGTAVELNTPKLLFHGRDTNTGADAFSIDPAKGLVRFSEPMYLQTLDGSGNVTGYEAAKIFLRTSFPLRDPIKRHPRRAKYYYPIAGGIPGAVETLRVEQLEWEYGGALAPFQKEADYYARRWANQYFESPAATVPAKGWLLDINVDGAIRSVTIQRSDDGRCTSKVEWQTESPEDRITYDERTEKRTLTRVMRDAAIAQAAAARKRGTA